MWERVEGERVEGRGRTERGLVAEREEETEEQEKVCRIEK